MSGGYIWAVVIAGLIAFRIIWRTLRRRAALNRCTDEIGDVVFMGLLPAGKELDYSQGQELEYGVHASGEAFTLMQNAFIRARTPVLATLDVYAETRISALECLGILQTWPALERALAGTKAERSLDTLKSYLEACAATPGTEVVIDGP